ncbi:LemA family protein [Actinoplanes sp. NPDC049599]|uniref:LemA family protein n=1 Tax=Actinoplanes sp. NPDC049599 TaxID=3363903 RepID=UPI00379FFF27
MLIALIIVIVLVVGIGLWLVLSYNGLVRQRNQVQEAWQQIDVELTRRHDLIPNLVETVKGYATHERETLDAVIQARNAATTPGASVAQQAQQEGQLSQSLGRLFAIAEAYPDLKANQNFLSLQNELSATEDRIAAGRRYYNANVRELNTKVESIPTNIIAGMFSFQRADYFEAENEQVRSAPQVSFGSSPGVSFGGSNSGAGTQPGLEPGAPAPGPSLGSTDPDYGTPGRPR